MNNSAWLWYRSSPLKIIARLVLSIAIFIFSLAPFAFAKGLEGQVAEDQYFLRAFLYAVFQNIVPFFDAAFITFGLLRYMSFWLKLDN